MMSRRQFLIAAGGSVVTGVSRPEARQLELSTGTHRGTDYALCADGSRQLRLKREASGGFPSEGQYLSEAIPTAGKARIRWVPQWVTPQRYKKDPRNPIYGPGRSGAWDKWTNGVGILRAGDGKHYHMYYADQKNGIGFAIATISDPISWKEHPSSPILKPKGEPHWEGDRLNQPRMARVSATHWRMYYTGWGQGNWKMGLAESFDGGISWRRYSEEPILPLGEPGSPDSQSACVPMVLTHTGKWHMWYTGSANRAKAIHICYATSPDGIHWHKYAGNPVLPTIPGSKWETGVVSRPFVLVEDGVYKMWYSMRGPAYRIGYAESIDGIHWERSPANPVLDVSPVGWDNEMVEYPEIDVVEGTYRMWYCGNGFGSVGYSEGIRQTSLIVQTRTGSKPLPDHTWSEWSQPHSVPSGEVMRSPINRYLQVRVVFRTSDPRLSPSLRLLEVTD